MSNTGLLSGELDLTLLPGLVQALEPSLRQQAFTHRSSRSQDVARHETNERLEFLGDAVLELYVSEHLLQRFPLSDEGHLTRLRAHIVRTESLAAVSMRLSLGQYLVTSRSEINGDAASSEAVLADTFESLVGAIYTQFGYTGAAQFIQEELLTMHQDLDVNASGKDAKSQLQELVQAQSIPTPEYIIVDQTGPDHAKIFTVAVRIQDQQPILGTGASKQKAEQDAASQALAQYFPSQYNVV